MSFLSSVQPLISLPHIIALSINSVGGVSSPFCLERRGNDFVDHPSGLWPSEIEVWILAVLKIVLAAPDILHFILIIMVTAFSRPVIDVFIIEMWAKIGIPPVERTSNYVYFATF